MSEGADWSASADGAEAGPSAGALVRQAREAAGLEVDALAAALKVTVRQIEALEADRWDLLPDAVFARALAASVCRNLKVDAALVLARLPQTAPRLSPRGEGLNEPFKAPQHRSSPDVGAYLSRPLVLGVLALLLGALVLVLMPAPQEAPPTASPAPAEQVQAVPQAAGAASAATGGGMVTELVAPAAPLNAPAPAAPASAALPAAAPAVAPAMALPLAPVAAVNATPAAAAPQAPASAAAAQDGLLRFAASADSWVKVTDARGTVVLSRLLKAGESAGASGQLPLSVVVGRADATRVQLRGQPMDLAPITRDNVARFEVK